MHSSKTSEKGITETKRAEEHVAAQHTSNTKEENSTMTQEVSKKNATGRSHTLGFFENHCHIK